MDQPTPPEQPPQNRQFRRGHKYSASTPANMQAYANRPLPPLPPTSPSSAPRAMTPQPRGRSATTAAAPLASFPTNRRSTIRAEMPTSAPRRFPSVAVSSSPKSGHFHKNSHGTSTTWCRRSSQQKVYQLTGMDVDVMDDQSFRSGAGDSDSSSTGSGVRLDDAVNYETADYHLVPVLETDVDESSSRGSSWGPMSPELAVVPPPLSIHKQSMRDGSEKQFGSLSGSFTQLHLDEGAIRPWDPTYGQFSDYAAAGEYHEFAAQLASRNSCQLSDISLQSHTPTKKKRSSLSLAFSAASRFRRRESPQPIDIVAAKTKHKGLSLKGSQQSASQLESPNIHDASNMSEPSLSRSAPTTPVLPLATAPPPRPSPAPPLMSAWDSDSDDDADDDGHVMSNLKDWFASRTSEDGKLHRRTSSTSRIGTDGQLTGLKQDQMRESIMRPSDRHKQIQMDKAAKRREQIKLHMKAVPEGLMLHSIHR